MSLLKNSTWNLLGVAIPILVAIPALGAMARLLNVELFGIFTLCYAVIGYASLFDLGMSRSVIHLVALHSENEQKVHHILGTATTIVIGLSLLAGGILAFAAKPLAILLGISAAYHEQAQAAFYTLALTMPAFLLSMVWFSYLEGKQKFYQLNILKTISGLLLALLPLLALVVERTLLAAVLGLSIARYITVGMAYFLSLPAHQRSKLLRINKAALHELLHFGGWLTLSNIISPIMVYFDRFFISAMVGAQHIAYYTTPSEAVSRALLFPVSLVRVLFPSLSAKNKNAHRDTRIVYSVLAISCGAISLVGIFLSKYIMLIWMGQEYTGQAAQVLSILMLGFFFNSLAQVPYTIIQAQGHAKTTAILHAIEVAPYLGLLYYLVHEYGLIGAAIAWTTRVTVDFLALQFLAYKIRTTSNHAVNND